MLDDGKPQPGPFFFGGEIRLKNPLELARRNAGAIVGDGDGHRFIAIAGGPDLDASLAAGGLARVLEKVDENFGNMPALRQQDRQMRSVMPLNFRLVPGEGRQHFGDGAVQLLVDPEFLHLAFGQLRVAHDFGDDAVGALDLLADDLNLLQAGVFAFLERALNGVSGVVDDAQRILYLVGDLRGQLAGRTELLLPGREFTGFFGRLALLLEQDLDAITTRRHER